jgi:hypothetical protein
MKYMNVTLILLRNEDIPSVKQPDGCSDKTTKRLDTPVVQFSPNMRTIPGYVGDAANYAHFQQK